MKSTKKIRILVGTLTAVLLLTAATSCSDGEPSYEDRETFAQETYQTLDGTEITFRDGITAAAYPTQTPAGEWLVGCSASDRDEQFDAYTLRHEFAADGHTTFTYLIYYPHGGPAVTATPELLEGKSGYVINLTYAPGKGTADGTAGYSLCYLSVTLPTDNAPRLRLLVGKDALGILSTVTTDEIPNAD